MRNIRECSSVNELAINAGNGDAKCFDRPEKQNTEVCLNCIYNERQMKRIDSAQTIGDI